MQFPAALTKCGLKNLNHTAFHENNKDMLKSTIY